MLDFLFLFTTIAFGSSIVFLIRQSMWSLCLHISLGWLIGSMTTGLLTTILTHFLVLSKNFLYGIMIIQVSFTIFAFVSFYLLNRKDFVQRLKVVPETSPWLYLSLIIVGITTVHYINKFYCYFPSFIQKEGRYELELEHSVIQSFITGCNVLHPKIFSIEDPFLYNSELKKSPIVYAFCSLYLIASNKYEDISMIIAFLNALATALAIFTFSTRYTNYRFICVILFLFNSSWAFVRYFRTNVPNADLVHNIGKEYRVPFYQIFYKYIIASKETSFSLPIALFSFVFMAPKRTHKGSFSLSIFSGVLASLCPSFMTSASLFILSTCKAMSTITVLPFAVCMFIKFQNASIRLFPIWKEYQMNGIFFSEFWCWVDAFGPIYLAFPLFPFFVRDISLIHLCITSFCPLMFCSFFRNGGYFDDNALAVAATVFPIYVVTFVYIFQRIVTTTERATKGFLLGIAFAFTALYVSFGFVSISRSTNELMQGIPSSWFDLATLIRSKAKHSSIFHVPTMVMNPVTFMTGKRIIMSYHPDLWVRGESYSRLLDSIRYANDWDAIKKLMTSCHAEYLVAAKNTDLSKADPLFTIFRESREWCVLKLKE